jgi:hypothetical protein
MDRNVAAVRSLELLSGQRECARGDAELQRSFEASGDVEVANQKRG